VEAAKRSVLVINPFQLTALLWLSRIETASVFLPSVTTVDYAPDTWIGAGIGSLLAIVPLWVMGRVAVASGGLCLVGMAQKFYGRVLGGAVGIFLAQFFLLCGACTIRHVVEVYTGIITPETPGLVYSAIVAGVAVVAAAAGATILGRTAVMVFATVVPLLLLTLILPLNRMNPGHLMPFMHSHLGVLAQAGLISFSFTMQGIVGFMLMPSLRPRTTKEVDAIFLTYAVASSIMMAAAAASITAAFGPLSASLTFPVFSLAQRIQIAGIIERMEILPVFLWTASDILRVALMLWAAAACLAKTFGLEHGRRLVLPLGFVSVVLTAFIVTNVFEMLGFYTWDLWGVYGTVVQVGTVLLLSTGYLLARKGSARRRRHA